MARVAELRALNEAPVLTDLAAVGIEVSSLWLIDAGVAGRTDVSRALLQHLAGSTYTDFTREAIARGIAETGDREAWTALADRYGRRPGPREAEGLAVALIKCAGADRVGDLLAMLRDPRFGPSRVLMVRPVSRRLRDRGDSLLRELLGDVELGAEAAAVLYDREVARRGRARRANG